MALPASGQISINDIKGEFGGVAPDNTNEYYRGGPYVTENNTGIPASGQIALSDFHGAINQITKIVSVNVDNLVLSDLFTELEWTSSAPKFIQINTGVTVGSVSSGTVSCRSGTTVNSNPMGGTLTLINNGYIYGAGGAANGGNGGHAFQAEIAMSVDNLNGRIYSGGGGGGKGGNGESSYYYPENVNWKGSSAPPYYNFHWQYWGGELWWNGTRITFDYNNPIPSPFNSGGYAYEKGANYSTSGSFYYAYVRRRWQNAIAGGAGGNGGQGQGSNQAQTNGAGGVIVNPGGDGGAGGNGGGWGVAGGAGAHGEDNSNTYYIATVGRTLGAGGGAAGNAVVGNANITWVNIGDRIGAIS